MAEIGLPKGSGKPLKVREKSVKSQGILKWILSGNPVMTRDRRAAGSSLTGVTALWSLSKTHLS